MRKVCLKCQRRYRDIERSVCADDSEPLYPELHDFTSQAQRLLGRVLDGRYLIDTRLGEGGMGLVVRARHVFLDRFVAVKLLHPELLRVEEQRERFLREARTSSRVRHPHVVEITDFGVTEEQLHYLVMELLIGEHLRDYHRANGPFSVSVVIEMGTQLCSALEEVHSHGFVHRDLKPENIFVEQSDAPGAPLSLKVLDFGVASLLEGESEENRFTRTGRVVGTPHYMSPEQIRSASIDPRTDIYALGCILWELLAGNPPFHAPTMLDLFTCHLLQPPPPVRAHRPDASPALERLLLACMAKDPEERPSDAQSLRLALEAERAVAPTTVQAPVPVPQPPTSRAATPSWNGVGNQQPMGSPADLNLDETLIAGDTADPAGQNAALTHVDDPFPAGSPPVVAGQMWTRLATAVVVLAVGAIGFALWPGPEPSGTAVRISRVAKKPVGTASAPVTSAVVAVVDASVAGEADAVDVTVSIAAASADASHEPGAEDVAAAPITHSALITSSPNNARVLLDGVRVGETPHTLIWSESDDPTVIELQKPHYISREYSLTSADADKTIRLSLRRKSGGSKSPVEATPKFKLVPDK